MSSVSYHRHLLFLAIVHAYLALMGLHSPLDDAALALAYWLSWLDVTSPGAMAHEADRISSWLRRLVKLGQSRVSEARDEPQGEGSTAP